MRCLSVKKLSENIGKRVMADIEAGNISASAVTVCQSGEVLYRNFFGNELEGERAPIDAGTLFRLASMTKPITAVAALILMEKGLISLDDEVEKYLPEFKNMQVITAVDGDSVKTEPSPVKPTVKHLLSHSSGIGSGQAITHFTSKATLEDKRSTQSYVSFLSRQPLSYVPGKGQEYSGVAAHDVLVALMQSVIGEDYEQFIKREIFDKCEMKDTFFVPSEDQKRRIVGMHAKSEGKSVPGWVNEGCTFEDFPSTHYLGGAGLVSSLDDYSNFARMLLAGGEFGGERIIAQESVKLMSSALIPWEIMPTNWSWGLSVRVITKPDTHLPVGTYGWSGAYGSHFWIDPENEITAVYMKNSRHDGGSGAVTSYNFELDVYASFED